MKPYFLNKVGKGFALFSLSMVLFSCTEVPSDPGIGRKKMPEFQDELLGNEATINPHSYNACGLKFQTQEVNLVSGANQQRFVSVPLPDASLDSSALVLINGLKPFAGILMAQWANSRRSGVMIDLRAKKGQERLQADYMLETPNASFIPVVLIWDRASASRATTIRSILTDLPSVNCRKLTNGFSTH